MSYFETRARSVLLRVAAGKTLTEISEEKRQPRLSTLRTWILDRPTFVAAYLKARRVAVEDMAAEVVALADQLAPGATPAEVSRQKLRIEARKWAIARMEAENAELADQTPAAPAATPPMYV